ncbi:hypothetical protein PAXINDRAFT_15954 [Paxillus involutus ATCC 200175]|uniref:DUF6533 domain-containing protein n=1 Tax=Paxillus involutus ATCC 200175 TaxID=664439 RepID=A0A0C9SSE2_PAXIN|nr:hypothetical protein PAXINDRAFT_15954 [Paxillus involutus ATCC 200175]
MATTAEPQIAEDLLPHLNALIGAHYLELACFTLLVYDYLITLSQEVPMRCALDDLAERFSTGRVLLDGVMDTLSHTLSTLALCINQGKRLQLESGQTGTNAPGPIQQSSSSAYAACTMASLVLTGENIHGLNSIKPDWGPGITVPGCSAPPASGLWKSFVPTMVIHSVLYAFTVIRAMKQPWMAPRAPLLMRLLREGGLVYFVAMVSAIFSAVGARLTTIPSVNYPAYSNLTLAVNAVAVSRLMLSARSLAGKLRTDPRWLLNPTELGRVGWRYAEGDGETYGYEIMVARDTFEPEMNDSSAEVDSISSGEPSSRNKTSHMWGL